MPVSVMYIGSPSSCLIEFYITQVVRPAVRPMGAKVAGGMQNAQRQSYIASALTAIAASALYMPGGYAAKGMSVCRSPLRLVGCSFQSIMALGHHQRGVELQLQQAGAQAAVMMTIRSDPPAIIIDPNEVAWRPAAGVLPGEALREEFRPHKGAAAEKLQRNCIACRSTQIVVGSRSARTTFCAAAAHVYLQPWHLILLLLHTSLSRAGQYCQRTPDFVDLLDDWTHPSS